MKPITDYTQQELEDKIKAIKAEREKTADALKRYEEELERRKQEFPLGVPLKGMTYEMPYEAVSRSFIKWFSCEASADKFEEYFVNFVEALQDIAEGKPIDIKVLLPLLPKGWVAMEKFGKWYWFKCKPVIDVTDEWGYGGKMLYAFNIKPSEDWRNSLMECGL